MTKKTNKRLIVLASIVLLTGTLRLLQAAGYFPFPNFTPLGAMALFGGAYFSKQIFAYLLPLLTLFASDLILMNFIYPNTESTFLYDGWFVIYLSFGLMVLIGRLVIHKISVLRILSGAILGALGHFVITNFFVWWSGGLNVMTGLPYEPSTSGLMTAYTLGLPFLKNMLIGNGLFSLLLFGGFELAKVQFPKLQLSKQS